MNKLLLPLSVTVILISFFTETHAACQICSFYTSDGQRKATCASTSAGSKTCIPVGNNCIQTADCCGCSGPKPGEGGSTCLTRVLIDCVDTFEPRQHNLPEFGIFIWQPGDNDDT